MITFRGFRFFVFWLKMCTYTFFRPVLHTFSTRGVRKPLRGKGLRAFFEHKLGTDGLVGVGFTGVGCIGSEVASRRCSWC